MLPFSRKREKGPITLHRKNRRARVGAADVGAEGAEQVAADAEMVAA